MKLLALALTIAAILAVPAFAATRKVTVGDNFFLNKNGKHKITIKKGSRVKFVWSRKNKNKHNAFQTAGPGHFHTPVHRKYGRYVRKFNKTGTYKFVCTYENMKLTVRVIK